MRKNIFVGIIMLALIIMAATPALAMPVKPVITIVSPDGAILQQQKIQYTNEYISPEIKAPSTPTNVAPATTVTATATESTTAVVAPAATPQSVTTSRSDIGAARQVIKIAYEQLGKRYVAGGNGPNSFDCSGLAKYVYQKVGINLPRTAASQFQTGIRVARGELLPGDLVFFGTNGSAGIGHVGIYVGDNSFIHAATSNKGVIKSSLNERYYVKNYKGAARLVR